MSHVVPLSDLFEHGVHFGHRSRFRNPKMESYIYGERDGLSIIDLDQTKAAFERALSVIEKIASHGGVVVFVGTKKTAQHIVREAALACDMPYVDKRWLGGMLTNFGTIRALVKRYLDMSSDLESGRFAGLTKKEQLCMHREVIKLEASLGGVKNMKSLPDALFVVDVKEEAIAVREANKLGIPVIGLVDTNSDPDGVNYVIPANDDAMSSILYFSRSISALISELQKQRHAEQESQQSKPVISRIRKRKEEGKAEAAAPAADMTASEHSDAGKTERKKRVVRVRASESDEQA